MTVESADKNLTKTRRNEDDGLLEIPKTPKTLGFPGHFRRAFETVARGRAPWRRALNA